MVSARILADLVGVVYILFHHLSRGFSNYINAGRPDNFIFHCLDSIFQSEFPYYFIVLFSQYLLETDSIPDSRTTETNLY